MADKFSLENLSSGVLDAYEALALSNKDEAALDAVRAERKRQADHLLEFRRLQAQVEVEYDALKLSIREGVSRILD